MRHVLSSGADPTIGFLHYTFKENRSSLVFDLMEPMRPIMDRKVLEFLIDRTFAPDDFILNKSGICRLHPQLARYVVKCVQDISVIENILVKNLKNLFR